jgi:hypothetical protein
MFGPFAQVLQGMNTTPPGSEEALAQRRVVAGQRGGCDHGPPKDKDSPRGTALVLMFDGLVFGAHTQAIGEKMNL